MDTSNHQDHPEYTPRCGCFGGSGKSHARPFYGALLSVTSSFEANWRLASSFLIFLVFPLQIQFGCAPSGPSPTPSTETQLFEPGDEAFGSESTSSSSESVPVEARPTPKEWSIALVTITGSDHQAIARSSRRNIVERFPDLKDVWIGKLKSGSAVFYGRFESPTDADFRTSMELVRGLTLGDGVAAFSRVLPARPTVESPADLHPYDLRTLRERVGNRHPVYSLQIAQWGTFGDLSLAYGAARLSAERYTQALRSKGFDAWFSHNSGMKLSSVNVGVFGADAYDPRSTLFAPEVELMMGRFPDLMVNGEPLLDPRTGRNQKPFLVEVPR
jgi:hypothetical protein